MRRDIKIKQTDHSMQVSFPTHGERWYVQTLPEDHILLTTKLVKTARFTYLDPEEEEAEDYGKTEAKQAKPTHISPRPEIPDPEKGG